MASPPRVRELLASLVGDELQPFLLKLNEFLRDVHDALSGNLTVKNNLAQCWIEVRITEGTMPNPIPLPLLKGRPPFGVTVERVEVVSGNLVEPVWVDWEEVHMRGASCLKLKSVYGLNTGTVINLRLLVKAE